MFIVLGSHPERGGGLTICYMLYGVCRPISNCYITQLDFFPTVIRPAGLFTNAMRIKKNGLLTDADINVCRLARSVHCLNRERNCRLLLMVDDSCYSGCHAMFYIDYYIQFLYYVVG